MKPLSYRPFLHRAVQQINTISSSKKSASYFTLTLTLLSLSFFGLFAIRPTLIVAITLTKNIQDLRKLVGDYQNKIGNIVRAQAEYGRIRNDIANIEAALPSNSSFSKLAQSIEKFALRENFKISQLQIDNVPISTQSSSGKYFGYGFNIIGTGSFSSISSFISHLVNWKRIVKINSMEFNRETGTSSGNLRLTIKATTYYEP